MALDRYERYWLTAVGALIGSFMAALIVALLVFEIRLPTFEARIDPANLSSTIFANPGVKKRGENLYDVVLIAKMWVFDAGKDGGAPGVPPVVRVPRGSKVTFYTTSLDVIHGLYIEDHSINLEIVPGQIARSTLTFNRPGEYRIICHQYCGAAHQGMYGTVLVE
jgi:cytochrome c oxidase subunit 2